MKYDPTAVPEGMSTFPLATPFNTFKTKELPIWVFDASNTLNVTLPSLGVPAGLFTSAEREIPSPEFLLKVAVASDRVTVVAAPETFS